MAVAESTSSTGGSADKPPPEEVTNASTTTSTTTESDEKAYFDYPAIRARLKERFEELRMPEKYMCWTRVGEPWGDEEEGDKDKKKDGETKDGGGGGGPPGSGSGGGDRVLRELFQPQVPPVSAPPEVNGARTVVGAAAHQDDDICSRLPIQYVNLFGLHPRLDPILTVKCRLCAMVLLQAAFTGHVDRRHKAEVAKYKCRDKKTGEIFPLSQLGRRGEEGADVEVMPNDELVEGEEQVNGLPFELGTQNGPPVPVPPTVGGGVQPSQPNQQRFLALHDLMDPSTIKSEGGDSFRTQPLTLQPQPLTQQPQQPRTFGTKSFSVIPGNYVVSSANQVLPGPGPSGSGSILATKSQPLAVAVKSSATLSGTGQQQQPRVPPLKINLKSGAATPVITVRTQPSVVTSSTTTPQQHHIITTGKPMITRISTPARFSSPSPMVIQNITNIGGGTTSIGPGFHSIGKGASVTVTMGGGTPTQATKSMLQQQSPSGQMSSPLVTALKRGTTTTTPMVVSNEQSMLTSKTSNLNTVAIKNYLSKQILEKQQLKQDSAGSTSETASSISNQSMEKIVFTIDEVIKKVGTMDEDDEYEDLFSDEDDEDGQDDDGSSSMLDVATPSDGGSSFHSFLNEDILSGMTREVPKEPLPKGSIASEVYAIIPAANSGDNPMIVSSFTGEEVSGVIKPPKSKGKTKDAPTKSKVKSSKSTASGASAGTSASSSTPSTSSHPSILTLTPEMAAQVKKKFIPCDKRLFDPEEHCGVQIPGMKKPCTRSLTCRMHLIALRRGVERPRPFEELLAEYKQVRGIKGNRDRVRGTGTGSKKKQPDTSGSEGGAHSPMIKLEGSGGKFMIKKEAKDYKKKPSSTANKPRSSSPAIATSVSPLPSNIVHLIPSPLSIKEEEEDEIVEFEEEDDLLGGQDDFDLSFELPSFEDEEPMVISPSPRSSQSTIIPNLPLVQLIPSAHHSSSTIVHSSHVQPQLVSQMVSSVPITLPPQLNTLSMVIGSAVAPPLPQLPVLSIPLEPITVSADEADDEDDEEVMDDDRDHDDDSNSADSDRPIRSCIIWDPNCKPIDESVYPRPAVAGPSDFRSSVVYCTGFSREQQQAQKTARHPFLYGMTFDDTSSGDDSSSSSNDSKPTIEPPTPTSASSTVSQQVNLNVETMTIDSSDNSSSSQVGPSSVTPSKGTPSMGTSSKGTPAKGTPSKGTPSMGTSSKVSPTCTSSTTFSMIQSISSPTIVTRPLQQSSSPSLHHSFATASPKSSATSAASSQQQPQQVGTKSILLGTRPFSSLKVSPSPSSSSTLVHKFASASPLVSSSSHVVGSSSSLSSSQLVSQLQQQHQLQQQRQNQQKLQQQQQRQPQQNQQQQQPQQPTTKQIYVSMSLPSKQSTSVRVQPTSTATSSSGGGTNIKQLTTTVQLNQLATKSSAGGNQFQVLHNRNIALHNIVPMMSSSSSSTSSVTSTVSATVSQQQQPTIAIKSSSSSPEPKTLKSLLNSATLLTLNPSSDKHTKTMVPATTSTKAIAVKSLPVSSSSHLTLATRSTPGHQVSSGIVRGPTGQFQRRQLVATTTTAASTVQNILLQNPSIRPRAASTTASATVSATTPSRSTSSTSSTSATSSTLQVRTPSTRRSSSFTEHSGSKDKIIEDIKTDLIQSYELKRRSSLQQLTSTSGSFDASGTATSGTTAVAGFELGGHDSATTSHLPDDIFDIIEDLENTTNSSSQNISLDDDDLQLLSDSATTQLPISNLIITTTTPGTLPIGSSSAITGSGAAAVVSRSTTGAGTTMVVGTASGSGASGSSNSYILLPISSINSSGQGQNFYILQNPSGGTSNLTIGAAAGAGGGSGSQQSTGAQQPTILGLPSGGGGGTSGQQTLVLQPIARQIQQQQTGGQANVVQSGNIQLQPANSSGQVSQQQQQQQSGQIQVQLYPANKKFKQG